MAEIEHTSLLAALAAFGGEDGLTFQKTKTAKVVLKAGGSYTYKYADLGDILPVVRPRLAKHGLSWSSKPLEVDGEMVLCFVLSHSSGETDAGEIPLGVPKGYKPQELGSAITYARRYAITAQLNLATEEDDDAHAAQTSEPEPPAGPPFGPAIDPEFAPLASAAAGKICSGNVEMARTLWESLKKDAGGYMPQIAANTLVAVATALEATPLDPDSPGVE